MLNPQEFQLVGVFRQLGEAARDMVIERMNDLLAKAASGADAQPNRATLAEWPSSRRPCQVDASQGETPMKEIL